MRGDRMKLRRELLGLTQADLGVMLKMQPQAINRYEQGRSDPSSEKLEQIARALEVTTDWLLGLTDVPNTYLTENDLSPVERQLIDALRNGQLADVMKMALEAQNQKKKPPIPTQGATDG